MSALQARLPLVGSNWDFKQYGESGAWVSDAFPYLSTKVDDLCFLKSMMSDAVNHDPALTFMQTGAQLSGRPSMGSWLSYGLDSENKDLPAYIVMMCRVSTSASRQFEMLTKVIEAFSSVDHKAATDLMSRR